MKKSIKMLFLILLFGLPIWYGETRSFECSDKGKCVTVWKTYGNTCYVIPGKYYGLLAPSSGENYIKTVNTSIGVGLIWVQGTKMVLAQIDSDSQIVNNNNHDKETIINYNINKQYNDSLYTYYDPKLHINIYRKNINFISVSIDDMGAL